MVSHKKKKPNPRPKIEYPPVPTKTWIPPDQRKKKPRPPPYKPAHLSEKLEISSLLKVWHKFIIYEDKAVLHGDFSQTHKRFRPKTNGYQGPCNCMAAVAISKLYKMSSWTKEYLSQILELGDALYLKSIQYVEDKRKRAIKYNQVYHSFFVGSRRLTMTYDGNKVMGKLFPDYDDAPTLQDVVNSFFTNNVSAILMTQRRYFAIWTEGHAYFLFDPTEHDEHGYPWKGIPGEGVCVVIRFSTPQAMVALIFENLNQTRNSSFLMVPCNILRMVEVETTPPENFGDIKYPIPPELTNVPEAFLPKVPPRPTVPTAGRKKEPPPVVEPPVVIPEPIPSEVFEEVEEYSPDLTTTTPEIETSLDETPPPPPPPQPPQDGEAVEEVVPLFVRREVDVSKIPMEKARPESVTYFNPPLSDIMYSKMGILRATTHQHDPRFTKYLGTQSFANAVAALAMLLVRKSRYWIGKLLDDVLKTGETIHHDTLKKLKEGETLKLTHLTNKITIDDWELQPKINDMTVVGRLQSKQDEILDLQPALEEFFRDNDDCVITGPAILAVWLEDGVYYMFDPNERDQHGLALIRAIQVGSDLQIIEVDPGYACLTWYKSLKDLVDVYIHNLEKSQRRDNFLLSRIFIEPYSEIPDPWYNFQGICRGKWILRGTFDQNDRRFARETRNTQCTANAAMALTFTKLKDLKEWTDSTLDEILVAGDALYNTCVDYLKEHNKYVEPMLMVDELCRKFPFENREINLEIEDCLVNGLLDAKDENDCFNLKKGMDAFFVDNDTGVITSRSISVAIWRYKNVFYYFDSHSRDNHGLVSPFGTSCVLRLLNTEELAHAIEANLGAGENNYFNISRISVTVWEMTESGALLPPLMSYSPIDEYRAIIRSVFSEKSPKYLLNRGKQTIPNCLMALGMMKLIPANTWTRDIVDSILDNGDLLYVLSMVDNKLKDLPEEEDIDEIHSGNVRMQFDIGINQFFVSYDEQREGNFEENLKETLEIYFNEAPRTEIDQKELLLESEFVTVSAWTDNGLYYLFDPRPRDATGQVIGKDDWSLKYIPPPEPEEVEEESDEDDDEVDEEEIGAGDATEPTLEELEDIILNANEDEEVSAEEEEVLGIIELMPKHSSHYWRVLEEQAKACVVRFAKLEGLIEHLVENTPPNRREELTYKMQIVTLSNKPIVKKVYDPEKSPAREDNYDGDWFEFNEIEHGRWILRGTMDERSIVFTRANRGTQSFGNCLVALAFTKMYNTTKFKSSTIDDILKYGDRLVTATRNFRKEQLKEQKEDLNLTDSDIDEMLDGSFIELEDIHKQFCVSENRVQAEVEQNVLTGDINAGDMEAVLDVKRALETFFEEHKRGILSAKWLNVAVWKGANVYYMFDARSRGPNGVVGSSGEACITRYLDPQMLADVFLKNLEAVGPNAFQIHAVTFNLDVCARLRQPEVVAPPELPKMSGYSRVVPGKKILCGTISLDDAMFNKAKNLIAAPCAIVALTMTLIHKCENWTTPIIDEIIKIGNELYDSSIETLGYNFNPWEDKITLWLVQKDYRIGTVKANLEIRDLDQRGVIDIKSPKILNLRQGIEKFFEENTHGVLETDTVTVAIWEEEETQTIYMFDPNPRGATGVPRPGGNGCVVTFVNPKMAADHFISLIPSKDDRAGQFVISPVEIVVLKPGSPPRRLPPRKGTKFVEPPSPSEKKRLRDIEEAKRQKKQAEELAHIGRFEYHEFTTGGDAILRGTKSQSCRNYTEHSRGNQDITNCIAALAMSKLKFVSEWRYTEIDLILDSGEQYYIDSYITYNPENKKLGLENVMRKFYLSSLPTQYKVDIYKPTITDHLLHSNMMTALINCFQQTNFCIVTAKDEWNCVILKSGLYYMFDPHDRDHTGVPTESGAACVYRFATLNNLVTRFISNLISSAEEEVGTFTIVLLTFIETERPGGIPRPHALPKGAGSISGIPTFATKISAIPKPSGILKPGGKATGIPKAGKGGTKKSPKKTVGVKPKAKVGVKSSGYGKPRATSSGYGR